MVSGVLTRRPGDSERLRRGVDGRLVFVHFRTNGESRVRMGHRPRPGSEVHRYTDGVNGRPRR